MLFIIKSKQAASAQYFASTCFFVKTKAALSLKSEVAFSQFLVLFFHSHWVGCLGGLSPPLPMPRAGPDAVYMLEPVSVPVAQLTLCYNAKVLPLNV